MISGGSIALDNGGTSLGTKSEQNGSGEMNQIVQAVKNSTPVQLILSSLKANGNDCNNPNFDHRWCSCGRTSEKLLLFVGSTTPTLNGVGQRTCSGWA